MRTITINLVEAMELFKFVEDKFSIPMEYMSDIFYKTILTYRSVDDFDISNVYGALYEGSLSDDYYSYQSFFDDLELPSIPHEEDHSQKKYDFAYILLGKFIASQGISDIWIDNRQFSPQQS